MLFRKMMREIWSNKGQFISIFILAFMAVSLYATMKASNISAYNKRRDLYKTTNTANGFIYGENFTKENVDKIIEIDEIDDAERRMHITGSTKNFENAQLEIFLLEENKISKPYYISGDEFDENDTEGVWISESFAKAWKIKEGDAFAFIYNGIEIEKTVKGIIVSPEYQYLKADKDLDVVTKNVSVVYMSYKGFPMKEYIKSLVENGDIKLDDMIEKSDTVKEKIEELESYGIKKEDIKTEDLVDMVDKIDDKKIYEISPYTELVFTTDEKDIKSLEDKISDTLKGEYAVLCDREELSGIKVMSDELNQHDQFAVSFPVIFIAIALLVIMTTMNRMIDKQRTQIGTMRALGLGRDKIIMHYLGYSFVVSALGSVIGIFFGTYGGGELVAKIFREWYYIPGWTVEMDYTFIVVAVIIVLACVMATYFSCRKVMNIHPAESLRPASPKSGKKTVFEKLPFWNKLGFYSQYNLRDISRGKLRSIMGIFGTAAGMMMMVAAFSSYTTIKDTSNWTFDKLQKFKTEIDFDTDITLDEAEELNKIYDGELVFTSGIEISKDKKNNKKSTTLIVTEGKGLFGLTDKNLNETSLNKGEVAVTMKIADALDISVGDELYFHLYEKNTWYKVKVGLINRNPNMQGMTMLREDYEKLGSKYVPNVLYTNKTAKLDDVRNAMKNKVLASDSKKIKEDGNLGILAVHDDKDLKSSFDVMMEMINMMIGIFIFVACVLPIVVLYNCGNLSFNERVKEFATLKVLGFSSGKIRKLLSLQNLWLSVIGIFIGAPFGTMVLQYMFDSNGDSMDYQVGATAIQYVFSGIVILVVSILVSYMFNKRIKKLDMVEILKGME